MSNAPSSSSATPSGKPPPWADSEAKKYLIYLFLSGTVSLDMPFSNLKQRQGKRMFPQEFFYTYCHNSPAFKQHFNEYNSNFGTRLNSLRELIAKKADRARADEEALAHDMEIYPKSTLVLKTYPGFPDGYPIWAGSGAETLLKQHLDNGVYPNQMTPKQLYEHPNHACYRLFPLEVFRKKIHQEIATRKMVAQWCNPDGYYDDGNWD